MTELFNANLASTTVLGGGTDAPPSGTPQTWTVASSAAFPGAVTGVSQFHVADPALNTEVIAVTNVNGNTWTVTRGAENTTPLAHAPGFVVYQIVTTGFLTSPSFAGIVTAPSFVSSGSGGTILPADLPGPGDWINVVTQYGADPTGTNDSTAVIQNAINAANSANSGVIYFPAGTYKISSALTLYPNLTLQGAGGGIYTNALSPVSLIKQTSTTANGLQGTDLGGLNIFNLGLQGPSSGSGVGISLTWSAYTNTPYLDFADILVYGFGSHGIYIQTTVMCTMRRVVCRANGGNGFHFYGNGTSGSFNSCWGNYNGGYGWYVNQCNYYSFNACGADYNLNGWYFTGCQSVALNGCAAEANTTDALTINGSLSFQVNGFWMYQVNHYGVHVTSTVYHVLLSGITEVTPGVGAVNSIITDTGSIATLVNNVVTTAISLAGSFQLTLDSGAVTAQGAISGQTVAATGLPGATTASRYVGATTSGPPLSGTFSLGDFVVDQSGMVWICVIAGSPGTWESAAAINGWVPADNGLLGCNFSMASIGSNGNALTAGTLYLVKLIIRRNLTISSLFLSEALAGSGTSTGTFVGLYSSAGTRLTGSSDQAPGFTGYANTYPLTTPQAVLAGTFVWGAILCNLSVSQPQLMCGFNSTANSYVPNFNLTAATAAQATNGTGLTSLPSSITPASNNTTNSQGIFMGYL